MEGGLESECVREGGREREGRRVRRGRGGERQSLTGRSVVFPLNILVFTRTRSVSKSIAAVLIFE